MRSVLALFTLTLIAAGGHPAAAQRPEVAARADAYVKALSSGSPDQFEAMAKDNFAPDLLARPADQRRQMVERIHADFGDLTVAVEDAASPTPGGAFASAADLLAFDNALRTRVLLDAKTTAWFFENPSDESRTRAIDPYGIAGGAPGANSSLESNGTWTVVTLGNLDPPNAVRVGEALAAALYGR